MSKVPGLIPGRGEPWLSVPEAYAQGAPKGKQRQETNTNNTRVPQVCVKLLTGQTHYLIRSNTHWKSTVNRVPGTVRPSKQGQVRWRCPVGALLILSRVGRDQSRICIPGHRPPQMPALSGCMMNVPESVSGSFCQSYFIHNEKEPKLWATLWLWALSSERGLKSARWSHTCLKFKGCSGQDLKQQPNSTLRVPGTDRKHMAFQNCIYFMEWLELRKGCSLLFAKSAVETNVQSQKFRTSGTWKKDKLFLTFYGLNSIQKCFYKSLLRANYYLPGLY